MFVLVMALGMFASAGMYAAAFHFDRWEVLLGFIPLWVVVMVAHYFGKLDCLGVSYASIDAHGPPASPPEGPPEGGCGCGGAPMREHAEAWRS